MAQKAEEVGAVRTVENWINGEVTPSESDRYGDVHDSATGERCAQVVMSTDVDVDAAIAAAAAALPAWSKTPVLRRARVMFRLKELIERARSEVQDRQGITLETEVHVWGEAPGEGGDR